MKDSDYPDSFLEGQQHSPVTLMSLFLSMREDSRIAFGKHRIMISHGVEALLEASYLSG